MAKKEITELQLDAEEIRASVQKQKDAMRFVLFLAAIGVTGYVAKVWVERPPDPDPSVECARSSGAWVSASHGLYGRIPGYCGEKKKP